MKKTMIWIQASALAFIILRLVEVAFATPLPGNELATGNDGYKTPALQGRDGPKTGWWVEGYASNDCTGTALSTEFGQIPKDCTVLGTRTPIMSIRFKSLTGLNIWRGRCVDWRMSISVQQDCGNSDEFWAQTVDTWTCFQANKDRPYAAYTVYLRDFDAVNNGLVHDGKCIVGHF